MIRVDYGPKIVYIDIILNTITRLVIGTSRTVGSAKKFVRITSGFGGGEFTKMLRKVCTCQKLKFAFLLLEYCKIRECYAVANAFTIRNMHSLLLSMFSFSCLRRSVLIEHIANSWADLLVWLIVFCKIDKLTLLKLSFLLKYFVFHKTAKYSNQNKLFSVHFQEMPGFKGKRKRGLTLTLYKKNISI